MKESSCQGGRNKETVSKSPITPLRPSATSLGGLPRRGEGYMEPAFWNSLCYIFEHNGGGDTKRALTLPPHSSNGTWRRLDGKRVTSACGSSDEAANGNARSLCSLLPLLIFPPRTLFLPPFRPMLARCKHRGHIGRVKYTSLLNPFYLRFKTDIKRR